jgi:hypothetical protein
MNFITLAKEIKKLAAQNLNAIQSQQVANQLAGKKYGPLALGLAAGGGMLADNFLSQAYRDYKMGKNVRMQQEAQF